MSQSALVPKEKSKAIEQEGRDLDGVPIRSRPEGRERPTFRGQHQFTRIVSILSRPEGREQPHYCNTMILRKIYTFMREVVLLAYVVLSCW